MAQAQYVNPSDPFQPRLGESEWRDLRGLVYEAVGIKLSEAKRVFLVSRLQKRLRATNTETFREYIDLVARLGARGEEYQKLINAITTNKTDFFREADHFEVLTEWFSKQSSSIREARARGLKIWCAASSTGEEPYTIAAVLQSRLSPFEWSKVSIVASDIDTAVLATAHRGVYDEVAVEEVDPLWRPRMFVRGKGRYSRHFRVKRELRSHVAFVRENLVAPDWQVVGRFDAVFCRNVLIYFDRETQETVVRRLLERVEPHGLLFLGAAESLNGLRVVARPVAHSAYAKAVGDERELPERVSLCPPSRVCRRVRREPELEAPRQELAAGEVSSYSSGWRYAWLDDSVLIGIHGSGANDGVVAHWRLDALDSLVAPLTQVMVGSFPQSAGTALWQPTVGKVVVGATPCRRNQLVQLEQLLSRLRVEILAFRSYAPGICTWVEPATSRVLVALDARGYPAGCGKSGSYRDGENVHHGR